MNIIDEKRDIFNVDLDKKFTISKKKKDQEKKSQFSTPQMGRKAKNSLEQISKRKNSTELYSVNMEQTNKIKNYSNSNNLNNPAYHTKPNDNHSSDMDDYKNIKPDNVVHKNNDTKLKNKNISNIIHSNKSDIIISDHKHSKDIEQGQRKYTLKHNSTNIPIFKNHINIMSKDDQKLKNKSSTFHVRKKSFREDPEILYANKKIFEIKLTDNLLDFKEFDEMNTSRINLYDFYEHTEECFKIISRLEKKEYIDYSKSYEINKIKIDKICENKLKNSNYKLALFDLNETLFHYNLTDVEKFDHNLNLEIITSEGEKKISSIGINLRPYLYECLKELSKNYILGIFTSTEKSLAEVLIKYIDPNEEIFKIKLFRENCLKVRNPLNDSEGLGLYRRTIDENLYMKAANKVSSYESNNNVVSNLKTNKIEVDNHYGSSKSSMGTNFKIEREFSFKFENIQIKEINNEIKGQNNQAKDLNLSATEEIILKEHFYLKDLRIIENVPLEKVVIIDNSILSFCLQIDNGIPIFPFYYDKSDSELRVLANYLNHLHNVPDVRIENKAVIKLESLYRNIPKYIDYSSSSSTDYYHNTPDFFYDSENNISNLYASKKNNLNQSFSKNMVITNFNETIVSNKTLNNSDFNINNNINNLNVNNTLNISQASFGNDSKAEVYRSPIFNSLANGRSLFLKTQLDADLNENYVNNNLDNEANSPQKSISDPKQSNGQVNENVTMSSFSFDSNSSKTNTFSILKEKSNSINPESGSIDNMKKDKRFLTNQQNFTDESTVCNSNNLNSNNFKSENSTNKNLMNANISNFSLNLEYKQRTNNKTHIGKLSVNNFEIVKTDSLNYGNNSNNNITENKDFSFQSPPNNFNKSLIDLNFSFGGGSGKKDFIGNKSFVSNKSGVSNRSILQEKLYMCLDEFHVKYTNLCRNNNDIEKDNSAHN